MEEQNTNKIYLKILKIYQNISNKLHNTTNMLNTSNLAAQEEINILSEETFPNVVFSFQRFSILNFLFFGEVRKQFLEKETNLEEIHEEMKRDCHYSALLADPS